jgi:hypothetical protein
MNLLLAGVKGVSCNKPRTTTRGYVSELLGIRKREGRWRGAPPGFLMEKSPGIGFSEGINQKTRGWKDCRCKQCVAVAVFLFRFGIMQDNF